MDLTIIGLPLAIILFFFFARVFWRAVITYNLSKTQLRVLFLRKFPIVKIPRNEIAVVKIASFRELVPFLSWRSFTALRLGNRLIGKAVLIERKRGLFKRIVITPDDAEGFVKSVSGR